MPPSKVFLRLTILYYLFIEFEFVHKYLLHVYASYSIHCVEEYFHGGLMKVGLDAFEIEYFFER